MAEVTFHKDVEPILQNRCQGCHHKGDIAPMSLMTYAEARPWAKAIRNATVQKKMPPWFADPKYGHFENDSSMSQSEIDTLSAWADSGAREGDEKDAPPPVAFSEEWRIGKPDAVIELPKAFDIPASGTIPYQYIIVPSGFTEDRWIQAVEVHPSNRAVVHHIIAAQHLPRANTSTKHGEYSASPIELEGPSTDSNNQAVQRGRSRAPGVEPPMYANADMLEVFVPGGRPPILKSGQARLIKAGSDILFQIHYTTTGKPEKDRTKIGFVFAKEPPREQIKAGLVFNQRFAIPARAANQQIQARALVKRDVKLFSMLPHMHLRGKDFEFHATYPSGATEVLLRVPRYDFHWQTNYYLAEPKLLPKGTILECIGHYDNSASNSNNPDPDQDVHYGPQTWDEMLNGFLEVVIAPGAGEEDVLGPVPSAVASSSEGASR
jgi:hypothetical protein